MAAPWYEQPTSAEGLIGTQMVGSCQVTGPLIAASSVTSAHFTSNAGLRSITIPVPAAGAANMGSSALGSTEYVLWRPLMNISVQRVTITPQTAWANPSNAAQVFIGNACSCMAYFTFTTCAAGGGLRNDVTGLSNTSVGACTDIRIAQNVGSSGVGPAHAIQIDYVTSG